MEEIKCEYCDSGFKTRSSLTYHQKTARYCIKLRPGFEVKEFECELCNKTFILKDAYNRHQISCGNSDAEKKMRKENNDKDAQISRLQILVETKEETINELKKQIEILQNKMENLALRAICKPTNINTTNNTRTQINTVIQNLKPINEEHLEEQSQFLTIEHIKRGSEGCADYAVEYPLRDRIVCVDYARRKTKYKNEEGEIVVDPEMTNLAPKLFKSISNRSKILTCGYASENIRELGNEIFEKVLETIDIDRYIREGADGEKSEFYEDVVKHICSKIVKSKMTSIDDT
jgi:hypothetical protein